MGSWRKEFFRLLLSPVSLAAAVFGAGLLALFGPFGTFEGMNFPQRAVYWTMLIAVSVPLGFAVRVLVAQALPTAGYWARALITISVFTAIFGPFVAIYTESNIGMRAAMLDGWLIVVTVFAISLAAVVIEYAVGLMMRQKGEAQLGKSEMGVGERLDPVVLPPAPKLLDRLSEPRRGRLVRLSGRDHYVDVVTCKGEEAVLIRLKDAVAEAQAVEGLQVHRSHWVARWAVTGNIKRNGRTFLKTHDGAEVPISRAYLETARDAGLV